MRGLGEEAEAVGPDRRAELEADQHAGRDHRDERRPPLWAHAPSIGPTRRARLRRALPTTPLGEGEVSVSHARSGRGDVSVEALVQHRSGAVALVRPTVPTKTLPGRAVLEVERAGPRVGEAREGRV